MSAFCLALGMMILPAWFAPALAQPTPPASSAEFSRAESATGEASTADMTMPADTTMLQVVPARFLVDIDGLESGFPDDQKAGGLVPKALRARENVRLTREATATVRTPDGTPVKIALDSLFSVVVDELAALNFQILSPDTLRGSVPYLLGYPMGTARSVVAEGTHPRALEIEIDVTVPDQGTGYWAVVGTGRSTIKGRPDMYLRVRYEDANGDTWREKVRVRSKEKVELSEKWLLGVQTDRDVSDASSLFDLTREATRKVVQKRMDARASLNASGR